MCVCEWYALWLPRSPVQLPLPIQVWSHFNENKEEHSNSSFHISSFCNFTEHWKELQLLHFHCQMPLHHCHLSTASACLCFLHLQQHLIWVSHLSFCQTDWEWAQGKFSTLWWKKKLMFWFHQYWHRIRVMNIWSAYGSIRYSMLCCDIELQPYQHFPLVRYSVKTNFSQIKSIWWILRTSFGVNSFLADKHIYYTNLNYHKVMHQ